MFRKYPPGCDGQLGRITSGCFIGDRRVGESAVRYSNLMLFLVAFFENSPLCQQGSLARKPQTCLSGSSFKVGPDLIVRAYALFFKRQNSNDPIESEWPDTTHGRDALTHFSAHRVRSSCPYGRDAADRYSTHTLSSSGAQQTDSWALCFVAQGMSVVATSRQSLYTLLHLSCT